MLQSIGLQRVGHDLGMNNNISVAFAEMDKVIWLSSHASSSCRGWVLLAMAGGKKRK